MTDNTILDLCGGTGGWSIPYRLAGYRVIIVDPLADDHPDNLHLKVEEFCAQVEIQMHDHLLDSVVGILCAPPCTQFAGSGSRWWATKDQEKPWLLQEGIDIVLDCRKVVAYFKRHGSNLRWWAMENPKGRMRRIIKEQRGIDIGKWRMHFDPCMYGGWLDPIGDTYTKDTYLWGEFEEPEQKPVPITHKKGTSPIHRASPGPDRWRFRSITPRGFANAFFAANP